jgi:hypothetical protein
MWEDSSVTLCFAVAVLELILVREECAEALHGSRP